MVPLCVIPDAQISANTKQYSIHGVGVLLVSSSQFPYNVKKKKNSLWRA